MSLICDLKRWCTLFLTQWASPVVSFHYLGPNSSFQNLTLLCKHHFPVQVFPSPAWLSVTSWYWIWKGVHFTTNLLQIWNPGKDYFNIFSFWSLLPNGVLQATGRNQHCWFKNTLFIFNASNLKRYFSQTVHLILVYKTPASGLSCVILILLYYKFQCFYCHSGFECRAAVAPDVFVSGFELCTTLYKYVSHSELKHTVSHDMCGCLLIMLLKRSFITIFIINQCLKTYRNDFLFSLQIFWILYTKVQVKVLHFFHKRKHSLNKK